MKYNLAVIKDGQGITQIGHFRYSVQAFQSFDLSVPDEGYFRNASCALNLISTFQYMKRDIRITRWPYHSRDAEINFDDGYTLYFCGFNRLVKLNIHVQQKTYTSQSKIAVFKRPIKASETQISIKPQDGKEENTSKVCLQVQINFFRCIVGVFEKHLAT